MVRPSGKLIIAGVEFATDAPIVNMRESGRDATLDHCLVSTQCLNGTVPTGQETQPPNYGMRRAVMRPQFGLRWPGPDARMPTVGEVQQVIRQVVLHHYGLRQADLVFQVLHDELGLSTHFIIDDDGTIYQTCDLAYAAIHAGDPINATSIGIMLCLRGDAKKEPDYYARFGDNRMSRLVRINGEVIKAFEYSERQLEAMNALGRALLRLLPNVAPTYPQSIPGVPLFEAMSEREARSFSGFLGHYHLSGRHWDPGPFDFKAFVERIAGTTAIPLETAKDTNELYAANEAADGGFFPVGPWGEARLWHGGVHLRSAERSVEGLPLNVRTMFPGRIVAGRMGVASAGIGSTNFALLRHDLAFGRMPLRFYSLYMHLASDTSMPWLQKVLRNRRLDGDVMLFDELVTAGEVIGGVGTAGPAELAKAQVHLEIFSTVPLFTDLPASPWEVVDGTAAGRFCDVDLVNDLLDANRDHRLSREELHDFFARDKRRELSNLVTLHVSEWTSEPSWSEALRVPADFKHLRPNEIDELVDEQITPTLWWNDAVAAHCELPTDGVVYHYHPVRFLEFWQSAIRDASSMVPPAPEQGTEQDLRLEDDLRGSDMADTSCAPLELDEVLRGSDAPTCVRNRPIWRPR